MSDTPKTDAQIDLTVTINGIEMVPADFARSQERRIAHLELALHQIRNGCVDYDDVANELFRSSPCEIRKICVAALEGKLL